MLRVALAVVVLAAMLWPAAAGASGHGAARSFAAPQGATLEVTVEASGLGGFGQVTETLPAGFAYVGSSLDASGIRVDGNTVSFVLLGTSSFSYTVTAPAAEGTYAFAGIVLDSDKAEATVGGATSVRVARPTAATRAPTPTATHAAAPTAAPRPIPTATPMPPPTLTPTPMPTAPPTARPRPTATPAPTPTATSTPTATPRPTATATPRPTSTPTPTRRPTETAVPRTTATPTPTLTPTPVAAGLPGAAPADGDGDGTVWIVLGALGGALALGLAGVAVAAAVVRRQRESRYEWRRW